MWQSVDEIFYGFLAMRTQSGDTAIEKSKKGKRYSPKYVRKHKHRNRGEKETSGKLFATESCKREF